MKKNVMLSIASVLLVAVLLSSSVVSGTFAKYVTSDSGSDYARVAKFGVVIEAEDFDMFTTDYDTHDTAKYTGTSSVSAAGTGDDRDDVLAPGTSGSFADIAITGTPEVAVEVKIVANVELSNNWTVEGDFYCPVVVTVGDTEFCGLDYDSADAFAAAIKANIDGKSNVYDPNTDLGVLYGTDNLDIAWEWAFEGADDSDQTDVKDTALGDAAATSGTALTISIGVAITVTQVD